MHDILIREAVGAEGGLEKVLKKSGFTLRARVYPCRNGSICNVASATEVRFFFSILYPWPASKQDGDSSDAT